MPVAMSLNEINVAQKIHSMHNQNQETMVRL